jgi:hypothetical protein
MLNRPLRILLGCEMSGILREEFRKLGCDAYSCDLLPDQNQSPYHWQCDLIDLLAQSWVTDFDAAIYFPPCTYLTVSGLHWNARRPERAALTEQGVAFFMALANCKIPRVAIENPIGCMSSRWRKPDQIFQPYEFGDDASKKTCLWLRGLPKLIVDPAQRCNGRMVEWPKGSSKIIERWSNQTDSGQNVLGPSEDRAMIRSLTYPGPARAMALQWFDYLMKTVN